MADEPHEALRALEERLARASQTAERLMAEAAGAGSPGKPPPAGWQAPAEEREPAGLGSEMESLLAALRSLRELIPPEIAERLIAAVRELLLALRALLDTYLERLEHRRKQPPEVEDIPIQ